MPAERLPATVPLAAGKSVEPCKRIVRVTERTTDRHGQRLLTPDNTLEGWWTDLDMEPDQVIALYRDHATSEKFHSEFKTDLDMERLPSGKFATNALVKALGAFVYNILRAIGQFAPIRHPAKRRRIRKVIQELIYLAGRLISTGRRLILLFSRHCPVFAAFQRGVGATCAGPLTATGEKRVTNERSNVPAGQNLLIFQ